MTFTHLKIPRQILHQASTFETRQVWFIKRHPKCLHRVNIVTKPGMQTRKQVSSRAEKPPRSSRGGDIKFECIFAFLGADSGEEVKKNLTIFWSATIHRQTYLYVKLEEWRDDETFETNICARACRFCSMWLRLCLLWVSHTSRRCCAAVFQHKWFRFGPNGSVMLEAWERCDSCALACWFADQPNWSWLYEVMKLFLFGFRDPWGRFNAGQLGGAS